ncbi:hypothetical protein M426DRAFT_155782 [Hypoxylon sp. CI-4A]|nr:hypothetical protein M426DRAFT_155782 [Hypoxylon sp. CI-4A]
MRKMKGTAFDLLLFPLFYLHRMNGRMEFVFAFSPSQKKISFFSVLRFLFHDDMKKKKTEPFFFKRTYEFFLPSSWGIPYSKYADQKKHPLTTRTYETNIYLSREQDRQQEITIYA